jgi:hypothetical protein
VSSEIICMCLLLCVDQTTATRYRYGDLENKRIVSALSHLDGGLEVSRACYCEVL